MKKILLPLLFLLSASALLQAQEIVPVTVHDSVALVADSGQVTNITPTVSAEKKSGKMSFGKRILHGLYEFVKEFSRVDTLYVEPPKYNFTFMLQNTNTYEIYDIHANDVLDINLAPQPSMKLGPYFGWRWIFLGYTFDLRHFSGHNKKEFDLSLYSSQLGIDMFYRKTGDDYKIKRLKLNGGDVDTHAMDGVDFDGLQASIKGFNIYYIFNHRRFSYPAAFNQSNVQRRSCGSALVGLGYTRHTLSMDWNKLRFLVAEYMGEETAETYITDDLNTGKIQYTDVSISGGYGYNWVFAHNWVFAASLSAAVGYKHTTSESSRKGFSFRDFSINNINFDGVGRFGIVRNNNRWFFGASTIIHSYTYKKEQFSALNIFGSLNIYVGFNFCKR